MRRCCRLILKAKEKETDAEIKALLEMTAAGTQIKSDDKATRLAAIRTLGESANPNAKALLVEAAAMPTRR